MGRSRQVFGLGTLCGGEIVRRPSLRMTWRAVSRRGWDEQPPTLDRGLSSTTTSSGRAHGAVSLATGGQSLVASISSAGRSGVNV